MNITYEMLSLVFRRTVELLVVVALVKYILDD